MPQSSSRHSRHWEVPPRHESIATIFSYRHFWSIWITTINIKLSAKYMPESSKGVKFEPLNHQKQTQGLKFDTLGQSRYRNLLYIHPIGTCQLLSEIWSFEAKVLVGSVWPRVASCYVDPSPTPWSPAFWKKTRDEKNPRKSYEYWLTPHQKKVMNLTKL